MNNKLNILGAAATLAMSIGYTGIAQAASVSTVGTWTNVFSNGAVSGVGTSNINWGIPATGSGQSGYSFAGVSNVNLPLNGSNFLLGEFTHNNFPIYPPSITGANLQLGVSGGLNKIFNFSFNHNETPNDGNGFGFCPFTPGYPTPCPDIVSIPYAQSAETVTIGGLPYHLFISGFQQNGSLVNQFITIEDQANSAQLYGRLEPVPGAEPIPEPFTIIGSGVAFGFGTFLKRKQSKATKDKVNA